MKKLLISLAVLFAGVAAAFAEDLPEITFETITHDFGTFPEESGRVTCEFQFTNTGKADLVLQKVRASCGCTTPEWTKEPVKPGDKGVVKATYNASGRPGAFTKTITVTTNAGEKRLSIKGDVIPKAQKIEDKYPHEFGAIRLMKKNIYFNTILYPAQKSETIEIVNNSKEDAKVAVLHVPAFITVQVPEKALKPGETAKITFVTKSENSGVWGSFKKFATLSVNGQAYEQNLINIFGNIAEDFSKMTAEEKANSPVISIANSFSLGKIKKGATKTFEIAFKNEGKSPLIIRNVTDDASNAAVMFPSKPIKVGKQGTIRVKINTNDMKVQSNGKFTQRLTVISNDPNRSTFIVNLNGELE